MKRGVLVLTLLFLVVLPAVSEERADGTILDRAVIAPAKFESVKRLDRYVSREEHERLAANQEWVLERVGYSSNGLRVTAWLYRPTTSAKTVLPVVVFNRGGYTLAETPDMFRPMFHRLSEAGFITVAPMLRESDGGEGTDTVGGDDLDDVMNVVPLVQHIAGADGRRLFLYGHSRGGMMTYQALRDGFPARAAASVGGFTSLAALVEEHPEQYGPLIAKIWPDWSEQKSSIVARRSAQEWPEKINAPLLILHGGADPAVDPMHSLRLAMRLQELRKDYQFMILSGGSHGLSERAEDRDRMVIEFFRRHLGASE